MAVPVEGGVEVFVVVHYPVDDITSFVVTRRKKGWIRIALIPVREEEELYFYYREIDRPSPSLFYFFPGLRIAAASSSKVSAARFFVPMAATSLTKLTASSMIIFSPSMT